MPMEATCCQIHGAKGRTAVKKGKERKNNNGNGGTKRKDKIKESVGELVEVKREQRIVKRTVSKVGEMKKRNQYSEKDAVIEEDMVSRGKYENGEKKE